MRNCDRAVILAGGQGTRLRPYSFTIPKPLIPIGEQPILLYLINQMRQSGVREVLIAVGYQSELIKAYFGNGKKFGINIKYFHEETALGTAGPLSLMADEFDKNESFFVANGDIYTELDFRKFRDFSISGGCDVTVGCVEKVEQSSYGVLQLADNRVADLVEKPVNKFYISSGIYVMNSKAVSFIPRGTFYTIPELINTYLSEGKAVGSYLIKEYWLGIENAANLDQAVLRVSAAKNILPADSLG